MRHEIADGLKALALLGVFMVNGLGYALAPYYPMQLGAPSPIDSLLAQSVHALVLTLFMSKALPFLVCLFGYSMAHYVARDNTPSKLLRRQWKLLLIGAMHGLLLYFGDILTAYALIGLWLHRSITLRGRRLVQRWRTFAILGTVVLLYWLWFSWDNYQPVLPYDWTSEPNRFGQSHTYSEFLSLNANAYRPQTIGWLLAYAPLHMCLFITGVFAARYRWLSIRPLLPRMYLRPWLYGSWVWALLANGLLAAAAIVAHRRNGLEVSVNWIALVNVPLGIWLIASGLTRFMLHLQTQRTIPRWLTWLAPAGRHTLMMYLGLSLALMLCGRLGLFATTSAWNHTAVWALAVLMFWLGAVALGRWATAKNKRDPISTWLSR